MSIGATIFVLGIVAIFSASLAYHAGLLPMPLRPPVIPPQTLVALRSASTGEQNFGVGPRDELEDWIVNGGDLSISEFTEAKAARAKQERAAAESEAWSAEAERENHAALVRNEREHQKRIRDDLAFEYEAARMMTDEQVKMSEDRYKALNPGPIAYGSGAIYLDHPYYRELVQQQMIDDYESGRYR